MTMDPAERDERVMSLAAEALKTPPPQRERWLQAACRNDQELYQEVSEVVAWEERMGTFLDRPLIEFIDLETPEKMFEPGDVISGRFEIRRRIGEGGMGVVYEAHDRKRKQRIAIKCAKPGFADLLSPELEGALKVRHRNICVVNEIHTTPTELGELNFLTMEFLDGETLSARLARGKLDGTEALEIARQLCAGVAEAHRSGVLHRDLKPGNVILCRKEDGGTRAVITDFGLATEDSLSSEPGGGTPSYMAPELLRREKASQASDVFSLGVILYAMVTGQKPFPPKTENNGDVHPPLPPSQLVKGLPHSWDKAILPCLRSKAERRCSADQVLDALQGKPWYRKPAVIAVLAASLFLAGLMVSQIFTFLARPPIRLAVLPVEAPPYLAQQGNQMLSDAADRVGKIQTGKVTVSIIPLSQTLKKNVTTPEEAAKVLGATHALKVKLLPEADGVVAEGAIIDLKTMAHVRDYSGHFPGGDLADLPGELTGAVAWALRVPRAKQKETVSPAAAAAYSKGREYLDQEPPDYKDALQAFQEAAQLDPHSPLPEAGLAEAHGREFRATGKKQALDEAKISLGRAEALNSDSPAVRLASGFLHQIQGDPAKALEDYQRVEEIDPGNVKAWLGSGLSFEVQGMRDKAMTDYGRATQADPANYLPYTYLGALYFNESQYPQAEGPYRKAVQLAPNRMDVYGSLAGVYTAQFKYPEAEGIYREALARSENALTLNNIGAMLAFQGRDAEAVRYYRRAVAGNPGRSVYWLNLGDAQRRLGQPSEAKKSYLRGMKLDQEHLIVNAGSASTRANSAYFLARLGSRDEAASQIAAALGAPARDAQVVLRAVQTYEALGDRKQALAIASQASPQTLQEIAHHPDLADLSHDPRFIVLLGQLK